MTPEQQPKTIQGLLADIQRANHELETSLQALIKTPLEALKLPTAAHNSLLGRHKIKTLGALLERTEEDLLDLYFVGPKAVKQVKKALRALGLRLNQGKEEVRTIILEAAHGGGPRDED